MRFYLKLFLAFSVTFGILISIVEVFIHGRSISGVVIQAILFGFFLALIVGSSQKSSVRRQGFDVSEDTLRVHQSRNLFLSRPCETAFEDCLRALESFGKSNVKIADRSTGKIEATTGWGWNILGDKITFRISESGDNQTEVAISSRPILRHAVVDGGRNLKNVETISNFLRQMGS